MLQDPASSLQSIARFNTGLFHIKIVAFQLSGRNQGPKDVIFLTGLSP